MSTRFRQTRARQSNHKPLLTFQIIPKAIDFFTGKALEYEIDDEDDEDEDDYEDEDDEDEVMIKRDSPREISKKHDY